ncbi:hypothetical protein P7K49_003108, partial [Saguinus oedipus]
VSQAPPAPGYGPAQKERDPARSALAGTPAALSLRHNPGPVPEIPELPRSLPGLPPAVGAEAAEIAEGKWLRPLNGPPPTP